MMASVCKRVILWWFTGRLRVKAVKITALAVIVYNVLAFVLMWCPPVRGVVVDKDTGKPIAGAIILKAGEGPWIFYSESSNGARMSRARARAKTDANGRFSFPAAQARFPRGFGFPRHPLAWFDPLWPFQWIDTIHIAVWDEQYIGADSDKEGLWWGSDIPIRTAGNSTVERFRLPVLGYWYKIKLSRPETSADWQEKIGSVSLYFDEETKSRWLFNDLTGYLERWPEGDKAGEYYYQAMENYVLASSYDIDVLVPAGKIPPEKMQYYLWQAEKLGSLAGTIRKPLLSVGDSGMYDHFVQKISNDKQYLKGILQKRGIR